MSLSADIDEANRVIVRRKHIWKDTIRAFSKRSFDCQKSLSVTFVGEEAVDAGGPKREFFHLALEEMANDGQVFQGPSDRRSFVHNVQALASRKFFYAGMLIALSMANGGPGFPCLAVSVFNYLCFGLEHGFEVEMEDLPDTDIIGKLDKIKTAPNNKELQTKLVDEDYEFIMECGFMKPVSKISLGDVPEIVRTVCIEFVVNRSTQETNQFLNGFETLNVGSLIKRHPAAMKQLLTYVPCQVTARELMDLLVPMYSPRGSNRREEEECIILNWNDYLQDLEGDGQISPSNVLSFITGAPSMPPMGFDREISIHFIDDKDKTLPTASTCSLVLRLPLSLTMYEEFKEKVDFAIMNTFGFGQV